MHERQYIHASLLLRASVAKKLPEHKDAARGIATDDDYECSRSQAPTAALIQKPAYFCRNLS
jgi:hypothetical protein